jgi:hypothetical protein
MLDITTLAAWGEFIGGIAVVVSLVYLASQIRQNSRLVRASSASTQSEANTSFSALVVQDPDVARLLLEGGADRESLSEIDRRRFDSMMAMTFEGLNNQFEFIEDGLVGPRVSERAQLIIPRIFQQLGVQSYWRDWREVHSRGFREFVDDLIREGEAAK